jgi:hypothetical protein
MTDIARLEKLVADLTRALLASQRTVVERITLLEQAVAARQREDTATLHGQISELIYKLDYTGSCDEVADEILAMAGLRQPAALTPAINRAEAVDDSNCKV